MTCLVILIVRRTVLWCRSDCAECSLSNQFQCVLTSSNTATTLTVSQSLAKRMTTTTTERLPVDQQVDESASFERSTTLDLRHYGTLTALDLERLSSSTWCTAAHHHHHHPSRQLKELVLGPYFAPGVTVTTILAAIRPLAPCLTSLHLNLSSLVANVPTRRSGGDVATTTTTFIEVLLRQHPTLQHLTLQMASPWAAATAAEEDAVSEEAGDPVSVEIVMPGDGLACSVARVYRCQALASDSSSTAVASLQSLNLNGNFIGDAGVQALVGALMLSTPPNSRASTQGGCRLRHLSLAHNQFTLCGCAALALLLQRGDQNNNNNNLQSLDLSYNDGIGTEGFAVLVQALQVNTTLRSISWVGCRSLQQQQNAVYPHLLHLLVHFNTTLTWIGLPCSFAASPWADMGMTDSMAYNQRHPNITDMDMAQHLPQQQQLLHHWLQLNWTGGRHLLRHYEMNIVPTGLWPYVMARANNNKDNVPASERFHNHHHTNNHKSGRDPALNSLFFLLRNTVGRAWAVTATKPHKTLS